MKISINGRGIHVTDDQKQIIPKKLSRFDKFFGDNAEAAVVLRKMKLQVRVELTISASDMLYRSEVEDDSWLSALDRCIEHIVRQIHKNKSRLAKRLRDDTFRQFEHPAVEDEGKMLAEEEEGEFVIHTKSFAIKPMSAEEAILQMNLLEHAFFVYKDAETGQINVVYKRKDGQYGRIVDAAKE